MINKKILLRERKRHTARRVSSTPSAPHPWLGVQTWPGYPFLPLLPSSAPFLPGWGMTPVLTWLGYSPIQPGQGTPHPDLARLPAPQKGPGTSRWGTLLEGHGTSRSIMGWRWGTPLVWTDRYL